MSNPLSIRVSGDIHPHIYAKTTEGGEAWAIRAIDKALPLGGGVRILAGDGDMLGAIGVSGAPSGSEDDACANAGIVSISEKIEF